jgi:predicted acetyltransferase
MPATAVPPSVEYQSAFLSMLADFEANDAQSADFYSSARADFAAYVEGVLDEERGRNLRDGWVPCTHRWLIESGGEVVGVTRLRHNIDTPFLSTDGGHIGYDVAPSHRRKGHGHTALRVALSEAMGLGIQRVLLVAAKENVASRSVIERQGGELESIAFSEFWGEHLCRYWLNMPQG